MALNIVDGGAVEVGNLVVMIYGQANHGKSTLALTASKPLLLDFDGGSYRAGNKSGKAIVPVRTWEDISRVTKEDLKPYDTVIVDTVGSALQRLAENIMRNDDRARKKNGVLSLSGFGALKGSFSAWLSEMRGFGLDVVLVAHAIESERNGETVDRIDAQGGSRDYVQQQADLIGRLFIDGQGHRLLSFEPTSVSLGKSVGLTNADGGTDFRIRHPQSGVSHLADIIRDSKALLNGRADEQAAEVRRLDDLRGALAKLDPADPEEWDSYLAAMRKADSPKTDMAVLWSVAKDKGMQFVDGKFVGVVVEKETDDGDAEPSSDEIPF